MLWRATIVRGHINDEIPPCQFVAVCTLKRRTLFSLLVRGDVGYGHDS